MGPIPDPGGTTHFAGSRGSLLPNVREAFFSPAEPGANRTVTAVVEPGERLKGTAGPETTLKDVESAPDSVSLLTVSIWFPSLPTVNWKSAKLKTFTLPKFR